MKRAAEKVTPWFPPDVKPLSDKEHIGPYETEERMIGTWYRYWDGKRWGAGCNTIPGAIDLKDISFACQYNRWRGLSRNPNERGAKR